MPSASNGVSVFTLGHSTHSAAELTALLRQHNITLVFDVRSRPYSRYVPRFNQPLLRAHLLRDGFNYAFLGQELGGHPDGSEYRNDQGNLDYLRRAEARDFCDGINTVVTAAHRGSTALLCAEENPARCHRRLLLTPALLGMGVDVLHVRGDGRVQPESDFLPTATQLSLF